MPKGLLANMLTTLPVAQAPQQQGVWQHDEAQLSKYGGAYLTDLAERCDALIEEQTRMMGWMLAPGQDVVDLDAGVDPKVKPRLADLKAFNRKQKALADEIDFVDRGLDLPEHYVIAFKSRVAAQKFAERSHHV